MPSKARLELRHFGFRGRELREHIEDLEERRRLALYNFVSGWALLMARNRLLYPIARVAHWYRSDGEAYRSQCNRHIVAVTDAVPHEPAPEDHHCLQCQRSIRRDERAIRQAQMRLHGRL
jgi:hypothetical protein